MKSEEIKDSLKILWDNVQHSRNVGKFAQERFWEYLKNFSNKNGVFYSVKSTEILSSTQIKVNYICTYGDMEDVRFIVIDISKEDNQQIIQST